jgi:hypothetical protein
VSDTTLPLESIIERAAETLQSGSTLQAAGYTSAAAMKHRLNLVRIYEAASDGYSLDAACRYATKEVIKQLHELAAQGSPRAEGILKGVLDAMQEAEELGGVADKQEYRELMCSIIQECTKRISAAKDD